MTSGPNSAIFSVKIMCQQGTDTANYFHVVYGCVCVTVAKVNSWEETIWPENPKTFIVWPFTQKHLPTFNLG